MKRIISAAMSFILILLYSAVADAQYKIVNFTDMNQINSLTDDGDYIWMSTSGGAFKRKKSDGSLVKVINTDNSGIVRNSVSTMYIDFFGNYWFGTNGGGISKFDGNTWTTYNYMDNTTIYECAAITSDLNGDLWFGVTSGVMKYSGGTWKYYQLNSSGRSVNSIITDDIGNIWAAIEGVNGGGVWKINPEGVVENIPGPGNYFNPPAGDYSTSAPYCLHKDNNNNIWMGGYGPKSLLKYNNVSGTWTEYTGLTTIYCMTQDNLGNIWFGTEVGVMKYDGNTFGPIIGSGRTGFNESLVMDILSDAQGKVWIGSYKGIAQYNQVADAWTTPVLLNAIPSNYAETVAIDSNNKVFVYGQMGDTPTFDGSVWGSFTNNSPTPFWWIKKVAVDASNNKYFAMPGSDKKLRLFKQNSSNSTTVYSHADVLTYTYSTEVVQDVKYDPTLNKVWIATTQGLFSVNAATGTGWVRYTQTPGALKSNNLTGLAINGSKVWYSTGDQGIGYFDQSNSTWTGYSESDGLPWNTAGEMTFDQSNNLWFICTGLTEWDGTSFHNWAVPGIAAMHVACDKQGVIWAGGYGGVAKFKNGVFRTYTTTDGLIDNGVSNIIVDAQNNVWIPTGYKGLTKLVPQTPVADFSSSTACLPGSTELTNTSTKTDALTTYQWDINNDGSVEYTTKDVSFVFPEKGVYDVKLKVMNDNLFSEVVHQVHVLEAPNVSLNHEGDQNICFGGSLDLQVNINNPDPLLTYQVEWSNGVQGTQQIWPSLAGEYYATVNNGQCETQSPSCNLLVSEPFTEEKVCMVTVDVTTGKNLIVWQRTPDAGIASYNIFKLFGNTYVPIGNISALDVSEYIDYNSSPNALAARYAISSIDTCGNESEKSAYHQTIQLGASLGAVPNTIVLDWTNYIDESKVWQPEWYYIYRGNDPENLALIDSISSAFTEWNDLKPGTDRYYQVMVKKSKPCVPKEYSSKKASSNGGPYVHSLSNLEDNRLQSTGINMQNASNSLSVFPNPFNVEATIKWENASNSPYNLKIYDLRGSLIKQVTNIRGSEYRLLRENLEQGVYLLELSGENLYKTRIFIQ
jgi:ligand-binding sensor domain-containing protein